MTKDEKRDALIFLTVSALSGLSKRLGVKPSSMKAPYTEEEVATMAVDLAHETVVQLDQRLKDLGLDED